MTDPEPTRAIARTLNARYHVDPYGLGPDSVATTYPVATFVTHLVYLHGCAVRVDVAQISVRLFPSFSFTIHLCIVTAPIGTWGRMHRGGERHKRTRWDSALRCNVYQSGDGSSAREQVVPAASTSWTYTYARLIFDKHMLVT